MALTHTLLPEPVVPAISRCGMADRSQAAARPATSLPRAKRSGERIFLKASVSISSRRATRLISVLGTSMPTYMCPGTGAWMRMRGAARASARSSVRRTICATRTRVRPWRGLDEIGLHAELGDGGSAVDLDHVGGHAEGGQGLLDDLGAFLIHPGADEGGRGRVEDVFHGGQRPGGIGGRRGVGDGSQGGRFARYWYAEP